MFNGSCDFPLLLPIFPQLWDWAVVIQRRDKMLVRLLSLLPHALQYLQPLCRQCGEQGKGQHSVSCIPTKWIHSISKYKNRGNRFGNYLWKEDDLSREMLDPQREMAVVERGQPQWGRQSLSLSVLSCVYSCQQPQLFACCHLLWCVVPGKGCSCQV